MTEIIDNNRSLDRLSLILHSMPNGLQRAVPSIINRALTTIRSQTGDFIRETYTVGKQEVTKNSNIKLKRASPGNNFVGELSYAGTRIPLIKFKTSHKKPQRKTVSVSLLQNASGKQLIRAYVANLGRYGMGVFERKTKARASSKQLMGLSAAHMIENTQVMSKIQSSAKELVLETIEKRVEHEISRILNGYGG
ncbi:MAG: hypothetical protein FWH05_08690 [Oscillospiraceae bacterium]|nr:hypothetical protein [Oscillospiraceae bacterium]